MFRKKTVDEIAVANLETASDQIEIQPPKHKGTGGYFTLQTYDGFDAVRLLLPRCMARVRQALRSSMLFAGIPNRDFLVVWTPDFSRRSAFATLIARDITLQPQPLTRALFVVSDIGTRLANSDG
ncbi:hypothetical protein MKK69_00295, partial [Methylobacterium sp. J-026]|uniref:hypothetical protein n=1 Tax=Methylobacterium sp. J-026 TaxID=2836624 RepID=UPI001FB89BD7